MKDLIDRRARLLGPNVPIFYREPRHIVRGEGVWLWDAEGRRYLDCYNNVPHVGHCHPRVVAAIAEQAARLNTHTRYLHDGILDYTERLAGLFDHDLEQTIMVCTGSEANDIAIRMAEAMTGEIGLIATDNTYHGNTKAVSQLSARRPPIGGRPPHIRLVPAPEALTPLGGDAARQGEVFARGVDEAIRDLRANGIGFAGFVFCPSFANEGFPTVPSGFLDDTAKVVREAGGLMICDEVQPGFGRLGSHLWGHDRIGVCPDVVTLGKPMANGHPVAAVITRADVMETFRTAFGYFNTFGGNPVSCAAAMATLDVLEDEGLQANADEVGRYAIDQLAALDHPMKADTRGAGFFFGAEFVTSQGVPATAFVEDLVERIVDRGVLINKIGRHANILKMRPPMPFTRAHADEAIAAIADALAEMPCE